MTLAEPMTVATDFLLAGGCIWFAAALFRRSGSPVAARLWGLAFAAMAVAAVAGGLFHGFRPHLDAQVLTVLWKLTVYAIGLGGFLMLAASLVAVLRPPLRQWWLALAAMKLVIYAAWMLTHNEFRYVIYDYAPSLLGVLILHILAWSRHAPGAHWMVAGALGSFAAGAVQLSGLRLGEYFNHNDLYHLAQLVAFGGFYLGACGLGERHPLRTGGAPR
ncbi:MAG: hypothetical protein HY942_03930 [Gammaproteobacteria bacterium]|nr:hypothetical protein [Gammaproteobacteria bacterium]